MKSVQDLYDDLVYWQHIGIADDIIDAKDNRKEYERLVRRATKELSGFDMEGWKSWVVDWVLQDLQQELKKPVLLRPTQYWVICVTIINYLKKLRSIIIAIV